MDWHSLTLVAIIMYYMIKLFIIFFRFFSPLSKLRARVLYFLTICRTHRADRGRESNQSEKEREAALSTRLEGISYSFSD